MSYGHSIQLNKFKGYSIKLYKLPVELPGGKKQVLANFKKSLASIHPFGKCFKLFHTWEK